MTLITRLAESPNGGTNALNIFVTHHQVVIPGDPLAAGGSVKIIGKEGIQKVVEDGKTVYVATRIGLINLTEDGKLSLVPLEGCYLPKEGDDIIGKIVNVGLTTWTVDIRGPYFAILPLNNYSETPPDPLREPITNYLNIGDLILARVQTYDRTRDPILSMIGENYMKLDKGRLIEIDPVKVPRVIGKKGSMIAMLKEETASNIIVGKNGRIVILAPTLDLEIILIEALQKIVKEAHVSGLTDRVKEFLQHKKKELGIDTASLKAPVLTKKKVPRRSSRQRSGDSRGERRRGTGHRRDYQGGGRRDSRRQSHSQSRKSSSRQGGTRSRNRTSSTKQRRPEK